MIKCIFCQNLPPGKYDFNIADLCSEHKKLTNVEYYTESHPNGECTDTCGCTSLEELKEQLL